MKVVIDEKIPYLVEALEAMGCSVKALPGAAICKEDVADAEALFVRTRTKCDAALLDGSKVRFIGTATIGYDHIDTSYCSNSGIRWTNAAGCNAGAVLQYIQSVLYAWSLDKGVVLSGLVLGVVGVGEIGSRVAAWAVSIGMKVLQNDPPREACGEKGFVSLSELAEKCDIITFHPSLNKEGAFPSYHLADEAFFASLKRCRLLINASRGPVVDNVALYKALSSGSLCDAVLDVWENEPEIDRILLNKVYLATPHIAGYSAEGKMNATRMVLEAFARFTGYEGVLPILSLPVPANADIVASDESEALLKIYSPKTDSMALKQTPSLFEKLRNEYVLRREPSSYNVVLLQSIT